MQFMRTNAEAPDFINLVKLLDAELKIRDGADHDFYNQFNKIDTIRHVVLAYDGAIAVGCGAFKPMDARTAEVKRMFVCESHRGRSVAVGLLNQLEQWAFEEGFKTLVLETGINQPEAIALYQKCGYVRIPNYGQYAGVENSFCFQKCQTNPPFAKHVFSL